MFNNIGGKIKALAKVLCWIGIAIFVIFAFIMFINSFNNLRSTGEFYFIIGLIFLIVGPILAWVSSFLLYGFGELIETNCEIERNTRNIGKYQENYTDNSPSKENNIYKS
ncbi:MAG: hypothetical protein K6D98_00045, partial [Clostridiales bacterium]|nr:hypothetical protein [Clostridiales bacterium]